jgi:hypothetical protein
VPHRIGIDSIHEELFLLLNLAYAAPAYAQQHPGVFQDDDETGDDEYYVPWLRYVISEKLLIAATKMRVVMEMLREEHKLYSDDDEELPFDLVGMQQRAIGSHAVGMYVQGNGSCDIRDCCNRIIHANDVLPVVTPPRNDDEGTNASNRLVRHWTGDVTLLGEKNGTPWEFTLVVSAFCLATEEFLALIETDVDWHRMFKYDNLL